MKVDEVLKRSYGELRGLPNVLNVAVGSKIVDGEDTGKPCIVIYVSKKVKPRMLSASEVVPVKLEGVCTDVVELKADYTLGDTGVSRKSPEAQRRIAGGVKRG